MRSLSDVIPCIGMQVIGATGDHGRVVSCNTRAIFEKSPSDDFDQYVIILWNNGRVSHTLHFMLDKVKVKYPLPQLS